MRCASCNAWHTSKNDILRQYNDKFIMYSDRACGIILSSLTASRRQYQNKPQPSVPFPISLLKDYCIHSFWSQNIEKRNYTISQMRLRSVFKMRMSILNAATTEQMGYGIVSFFVYSIDAILKSSKYHIGCIVQLYAYFINRFICCYKFSSTKSKIVL